MKRNVETSILANGIRIATDKIDHVESVTLGCWFNVGARDEEESQGGAAHFLEHMAFKGTNKRNAKQLAEAIEAVGGLMNAYTGRERTAYHLRIMKEDIGLGVDVLSDILQDPLFDENEFERERGVILQEIGQCEDTPDDIIFDRYLESCYAGNAFGRPILGTSTRIQNFKSMEIAGFMQDHYACDNMVVAASGNIDHDVFCKLVENSFDKLPQTPKRPLDRQKPPYQAKTYHEFRDNEQVHLILGFEAMGFLDSDFIAMNLMGNLLGGGMSSRLFQRIREEMGLAYSVYSSEMPASDCGLFMLYAGTGKEEIKLLLPALLEEVDKIREYVSEEELRRSKAQLRASLLMSRESTTSRAEQMAHHLHVYGKIISDDEILARINAVEVQDILNVAGCIFASPSSMAMLGPIDHYTQIPEL